MIHWFNSSLLHHLCRLGCFPLAVAILAVRLYRLNPHFSEGVANQNQFNFITKKNNTINAPNILEIKRPFSTKHDSHIGNQPVVTWFHRLLSSLHAEAYVAVTYPAMRQHSTTQCRYPRGAPPRQRCTLATLVA